MKYRIYCGIVLIIGIGIVFGSCNSNSETEESLPILKQGSTPLPHLSEQEYQAFTNSMDFEALKPILVQAQVEADSIYAAVMSVRDSSESKYTYYIRELTFSKEAIDRADGDIQPYFFEITPTGEPNNIIRVVIAYVPASDLDFNQMTNWIKPRTQLQYINKEEVDADLSDCLYEITLAGNSIYDQFSLCD
ncbi:hypothetical protein [Gracilimonas mengyeensis]|uniref:Uncharacterized protein n=1 Tax=Gracilimonas mengyeensis TaxID=1302730 RepID=A0A521EM84_9BACT|nr:hypothetical protein [Gracilimonas mengyeensis]SMO85033.1 hypothetical protein SAMN06265219_112155 [Gracilimonas mengyeensis]